MFGDKGEDDIRDENCFINYKKLERLIFSKRRDINDGLIKKHFLVQDLETLLKKNERN